MAGTKDPFLHVLMTLYHVEVNHYKTWCYLSRLKARQLVFEHYGYWISIRMVNYYYKKIKEAGLIKSWRNWAQNPDGTIYGKPSNFQVTPKGIKWLFKTGFKVIKYLLDWAYKGILPSGKKRPKIDNVIPHPQRRSGGPESLGSIFNKMVIPEIV